VTATDTEPVATTSARHLIQRGPSRRWMTVFCSLLALAVVAAAGLTYVGIETVRSSRAGQVVSTVTDPTAPGFEAFLEPTPTLALLHVEGGELRSIAVMALHSGDVGGSILLVSPRTFPKSEDLLNYAALMSLPGAEANVVGSLQKSLGFGIAEVAVVDGARWAELVGPVGPLEVESPTSAGSFPAGPITLPADQVGAYLAATGEGEVSQPAVLRERAFFRAWLDAVAASDDPAVVPGEVELGLGRFVRGVANGPHAIETAPVAVHEFDGVQRTYLDRSAMDALVPDLVPFPVAGEPGGRVRVRLLDGTGDPKHVQRAAPLVVPGDAEIVVVGNADAFDYRATEIRYHNPLAKVAARTLQDALGTGELVDDPRQTDTFDVTIILGPDL
jgi:LytR cell envelope-related transcriptional attenuator